MTDEFKPIEEVLGEGNSEQGFEYKPVEELLSQPEATPNFLTSINTPTEPEKPSYGRIGASVVGGGLIGTAIGGPVGGVAGGGVGLVSGVMGEVSRAFGNRPIVTFGVEMLGGPVSMGIKKFGTSAIGLLGRLTGRENAELLNRTLRNFTNEDKIILRAKENLFGPTTFKGMYSSKYSDEAQTLLKKDYGLDATNSRLKASDQYREVLYDDIDKLAKESVSTTQVIQGKPNPKNMGIKDPDIVQTFVKPKTFINSEQGQKLLTEAELLVQRKLLSPTELKNLKKILNNQNSKNPELRDAARKDILNLIQNAGQYNVGNEVKQLISTDAQKLLRNYFGDYLESNVNKNSLNILKEIEQKEFIAAAMDSIPTIVSSSFRATDEAFIRAAQNIAKDPRGKREFVKAINQHFKMLGETGNVKTGVAIFGRKESQVGRNISFDDMMKEFHRIRPALEKSGVMGREELIELSKKLAQLPKEIGSQKLKQLGVDLLKNALIGAVSAEAPIRAEQGFNFTIPTL